jgi:hypothetical protein
LQALLQQTPSAQWFEEHSKSLPQTTPMFFFGVHILATVSQ